MYTNYPIIYLQYILQYFLSNFLYLGTGESQEFVFTSQKNSQYIIIFISNTSVNIQGDFDILNQLKQYLLQLNLCNS